jgi:diadenosine tetraphosphate (Ap4A) HIT family hydrolase
MLKDCPVEDCPFCEIKFSIPEEIIWESKDLFAFFDVRKRGAAEHILLCSREHIKNIHTLEFRHLGI